MRRFSVIFAFLAGMLAILPGPLPAVERTVDESSIKECISPATTLKVAQVKEFTEGKDICVVNHTGPPAWCMENWIQGPREYYASYQDPLLAGCIDPYPFQVAEINFVLCATLPCLTEIYVDVMEANLDDPTCPFPGQSVFTSDFITLDIPAPGNLLVTVPLEERVCVDAPYFVGFCFPQEVDGLGPVTDDTPDGCQSYIWFDVDPWDLVSQVGFPGNILLYSVGLTAPENNCGEYPEPLPYIVQPRDTAWYDQCYFSDSIRITVDDTSDGSAIDYATFDYMDESGIWYPLGTDYDGTDVWINDWDTSGVDGDGWSHVWVGDGLEEGYYLIRATLTDSMGRSASDTITTYYDPLPPVPTIIQPESTGVYCGPIEVLFTVDADHIAQMEGTIFNFSEGWLGEGKGADSTYNKGISPMHQDSLYGWGKNKKGQAVNAGCCPTAGAACLKWWAGQSPSYGPLTAGLSDKQLVNALAGKKYMKTSSRTGTKASKVASGLNKWVWHKLGLCWFKNVIYENNINKITFALYAREIKREDILIGWSGKPWHATTGNSVTAQSSTYDVMNPATGAVETYKWPKGSGNRRIGRIWILSPKVQPQPPPGTPGPPPIYYSDNTYGIVWTPDTAETPYNKHYTFEVTVTDSLGHVGRDLFHFELADYVCGDANGDGVTSVGDIVFNVNYLYREGEPPEPIEAGDANCDGIVNVGDVVYLVTYLYKEGPLPGCF